MSLDTDVIEIPFEDVTAGQVLDVAIPTYDIAHVLVEYGLAREPAVVDVDYTVELSEDLQTVEVTVLTSLVNKINQLVVSDVDEENVMYVRRELPYLSDFQETDAFLRARIVKEFDRTLMRLQQLHAKQAQVLAIASPFIGAPANTVLGFDANGDITYYTPEESMTQAVRYDIPQNLTEEQKRRVQETLGITDGFIRTEWFGTGINSLTSAWLLSVSDKNIIVKDGTYEFRAGAVDFLTGTDVNVDLRAAGSTFVTPPDTARFMRIIGSYTDIQDVTAASGDTLTGLANGLVYNVGDQLKLVNEEALPESPYEAKKGEWITVLSRTASTVTATAPFRYTYGAASSIRVGRPNLTNRITTALGEIASASGRSGEFFMVQSLLRPKLFIEHYPLVAGHGIRAISCIDADMHIGYMGRGGSGTNVVGVASAGSLRSRMRVDFAGHIRHACDAGGGTITGAVSLAAYGCDEYATCSFNSVGSAETPGTTHQGVHGIKYENSNIVRSAAGGIGIRGTDGIIEDCVAIDCNGTGFASFRQSGIEYDNAITDRTTVKNCVVIGRNRFVGSFGDMMVMGGNFELSAGASVSRAIEIQNGGLTFKGRPNFNFKGTISTRVINTQTGTTFVDLGDAQFYFAQASGLPRIIDNALALPLVIRWDRLVIDNPNAVIPAIYGATASLVAGSRFGDAVITGGITAPLTGIADADLLPYLTGVIYDMANRKVWRQNPTEPTLALGSITSGTVSLDPRTATMQTLTNNGAFTLDHASQGFVGLIITNGASAGAINTSAYGAVIGDPFNTTNGKAFNVSSTFIGTKKVLVVVAIP